MELAPSTWALVVGIDNYHRDRNITDLTGCVGDAVAAVGWLRALGVEDDRILLHTAPQPSMVDEVRRLGLGDRGATHDELLESILALRERSGSRLLVFFSGHGLYEPTTGPLFLTADARSGCLRNLGLDEYINFFLSFDFPQQFLFLDGCLNYPYQNGHRPRLHADGPAALTGTYTPRRNNTLWAAYAAENGELAVEDSGRGLFLHHLLTAVDPRKPHPGVLCCDERGRQSVNLYYAMYKVVQPRVIEESVRLGRVHHPGLAVHGRRSQRPDMLTLYSLVRPAPAARSAPPASRPRSSMHPSAPGPDRVLGRAIDLRELIDLLLDPATRRVVITGRRGIGRTTLCREVLADPQIRRRFGSRRYHVPCEGVRSPEGIMTELTRTLGVSWAGENVASYLQATLSGQRSVIVLDDLDSASADEPAVRELLNTLGTAPHVVLTSFRGGRAPFRVDESAHVDVGPLAAAAARELFLDVAGQHFGGDPELDPLLTELGGVPLAIERIGYLARREPELGGLLDRLRAARPTGTEQEPEHDPVGACLRLALADSRLTPDALRLLDVLSLLPDGLSRDRLAALLPAGRGRSALAVTQQLVLTYRSADRILPRPAVREHLLAERELTPDDLDWLLDGATTQAAGWGPVVGGVGGRQAASHLAAEIKNITFVLRAGLEAHRPAATVGEDGNEDRTARCVAAAIALGPFLRFSGLGSVLLLARARDAATELGWDRGTGECDRLLGDIDLYRSAFAAADAHYRQGAERLATVCAAEFADDGAAADRRWDDLLPFAASVTAAVSRAACVRGLGHLALVRQEYDVAAAHYRRSLTMCRDAGDRLGEGDSRAALADVAMALDEVPAARALYTAAEDLYQRVAHVRGIANCLAALADVQLREGDLPAARAGYAAAFPFYVDIGHVHGEGKCLRGLADVDLAEDDVGNAVKNYRTALACYERVGDIRGQLACHEGLRVAYQRTGQTGRERDSLARMRQLERRRRPAPAADDARRHILELSRSTPVSGSDDGSLR